MKPTTAFLAIAMGLALVGCSSGPGVWSDAVGREWTLTRLDGKRPLPQHTPTLTLAEDGRVAGRSGGNRFFGTYKLPESEGSDTPGAIRFGALGSTRMFLDDPPGLMQQEQRYLDALGQVDRYRVTADELELRHGRRTRLVFEPTADSEAPDTDASASPTP